MFAHRCKRRFEQYPSQWVVSIPHRRWFCLSALSSRKCRPFILTTRRTELRRRDKKWSGSDSLHLSLSPSAPPFSIRISRRGLRLLVSDCGLWWSSLDSSLLFVGCHSARSFGWSFTKTKTENNTRPARNSSNRKVPPASFIFMGIFARILREYCANRNFVVWYWYNLKTLLCLTLNTA